MKQLIAITGSILFVFILISYFVPQKEYSAVSEGEGSYEVQNIIENEKKTLDDTVTFIVAEYNKRVAVFEKGKKEVIYISDTYVGNLPAEDRKKLKEGIEVSDRRELKRLIEDYCT